MQGFDRTSKYKFEGGDAAWEEEKLGSYAYSEVRFVEIHENLCSEVSEGKDQCYNLLDEYDEVSIIYLSDLMFKFIYCSIWKHGGLKNKKNSLIL